MKKYIFILSVFISCGAISAELEVGKGYRLTSDFTVYRVTDPTTSPPVKEEYTAGKFSRFNVIGKSTNGYEIQFEKVYKIPTFDQNGAVIDADGGIVFKHTGLTENMVYVAEINKSDGGEIENRSTPSNNGLSSGPLIVPFKYRLNSKKLDGEATLGYYFGYAYDLTWLKLKEVSWVPFLSGGMTQVSVAAISENGELTESTKTGVTWSGGFFLNNWDKVNIGFVFGQDRTGDKNWEHEGRTWISFSVGWEL